MKAFTDLEQSKKLAEILPLESADMCYKCIDDDPYDIVCKPYSEWKEEYKGLLIRGDANVIPCWSLAAFLELLDYPQLSKDKLGSGREGWMVSVYPDNCRYDSCWHDNSIDVCYEMILKLHEQNLL